MSYDARSRAARRGSLPLRGMPSTRRQRLRYGAAFPCTARCASERRDRVATALFRANTYVDGARHRPLRRRLHH